MARLTKLRARYARIKTTHKARRKLLERLVWKHTHADFKGKIGDVKHVLHNEHKGAGTESWPLSSFSDRQLLEKLPRRVREEQGL